MPAVLGVDVEGVLVAPRLPNILVAALVVDGALVVAPRLLNKPPEAAEAVVGGFEAGAPPKLPNILGPAEVVVGGFEAGVPPRLPNKTLGAGVAEGVEVAFAGGAG